MFKGTINDHWLGGETLQIRKAIQVIRQVDTATVYTAQWLAFAIDSSVMQKNPILVMCAFMLSA